jgi:hypothetical protein
MTRRFNRFELKYVIPASVRDELLLELENRTAADEHGVGGSYEVTSLYYDTDDYAFYRSKIDGIKYRRKLRIRRYGVRTVDENPEVMFEIKQRINRTTQKRRVPLRLRDAYALAAGESVSIPRAEDALVADEIAYLARTMDLRPSCVVAYVRQAFVGHVYELGLRITFDQAIWCNSGTGGLLDESARHILIPPNMVVMEVKANNAVPLWVSRMLARHRIPLSRFSKYCTAVSCLASLGALRAIPHGDAAWMS